MIINIAYKNNSIILMLAKFYKEIIIDEPHNEGLYYTFFNQK